MKSWSLGGFQDIASIGSQVDIPEGASLNAPPAYIGQVIGNLIDNGLKYNKSMIPLVCVELIDSDNEVKIMVSNNGKGIEKIVKIRYLK